MSQLSLVVPQPLNGIEQPVLWVENVSVIEPLPEKLNEPGENDLVSVTVDQAAQPFQLLGTGPVQSPGVPPWHAEPGTGSPLLPCTRHVLPSQPAMPVKSTCRSESFLRSSFPVRIVITTLLNCGVGGGGTLTTDNVTGWVHAAPLTPFLEVADSVNPNVPIDFGVPLNVPLSNVRPGGGVPPVSETLAAPSVEMVFEYGLPTTAVG
jgi:hypothetical protein